MRRPKKSKYKSVVINKKRYYYYKITWIDPTGDSGHATAHDSLGLLPSTMITHAYLFDRNNSTDVLLKINGYMVLEPVNHLFLKRLESNIKSYKKHGGVYSGC